MTIYILLGLIILFAASIFLRAAFFKPEKSKEIKQTLTGIEDSAVENGSVQRFQEMIQHKTISYNDRSKIDFKEFERFKEMLVRNYPRLNEACTRELYGDAGVLYRWPGKTAGDPVVLMSHYDVVPVNEELWTKPAFEGLLENGVIWGRGTLDTKGTLCGVVEAVEKLIGEGFVPETDIYLSFSGDEEISGNSAPTIVEALKSRGIRPKLVLDEGGAIVENVFPGVTKPSALIGVGEKGYMDVVLEMSGKGGHSSAPPSHTLVGRLAKAVVKLEQHPFKANISPAVKEMFEKMGRHSTFMYRLIFANMWCFGPLLKVLFTKQGGEMNALIRTTLAPTVMEGSQAFNVMPPKAKVGLNLRLMVTDTVESSLARINSIISDPEIQVTCIGGHNASPIANTTSEGWKKVERAIEETWQGTIVSPYLMLAASDSRHFCAISDNVLRFSAMTLSSEERGMIHGNDERITVKALMETVAFYIRLIKQL
ncbi:MAG: M20 family peptidase [Sedimentibacter saalensis]|uniref:M20 family peptidase n=1 Tax=Sedimentibacter saalensis TaxID=130788 RepID=UPI002B1E943B|nr:M20 family peptidase [Sedimentibacter saalensis]MEA5095397.1 M20 family peptidase [Sedimentibacter saalensis]